MSRKQSWTLTVARGTCALLSLPNLVSQCLNGVSGRFKRNGELAQWLWRRVLGRGLSFLLPALLVLASSSFATDATDVGDRSSAKQETNTTPDVMRAYLELQEQLHAAQLAIEHNRQEAEAAATHNAEVIATRLKAMEDSLAAQRESLAAQRESLATQRADELEAIDAIQDANRLMIRVGSVCAAVGFLALLFTAYFQWRAVNRLTEFSVASQAALSIGHGVLPAPGANAVGNAAEQANMRLLGTLDRLEKRIAELEHTAHLPPGEGNAAGGTMPADGANTGLTNRTSVLLAKGESLLRLDKGEEALACFDEILAQDPDHSEALVKKGDALDRLRKFDDAINCYDRAIAAGGSQTIAYLHKGGLFNRLERYEEALQCYEQALRTQESSHSA
jgi:tetratricopeptide (TPR) repeat protein